MPIVKVNHASIYYEVHGDGPAVTFAHGAGGNTLVWWQQIPYFARDHKVVVFDHRGFGRSPCDEGYKHARYFADDLKAVLDDAGVVISIGLQNGISAAALAKSVARVPLAPVTPAGLAEAAGPRHTDPASVIGAALDLLCELAADG